MLSRLLMQCMKVDFMYHDTRPLRFAISLSAVLTSLLFMFDLVSLPGYTIWNIDDFVPSKCLPMIYGILGVIGMYFASTLSGFTFTDSKCVKPTLFSITHLGLAFVNLYALTAALILNMYTPFLAGHAVITMASVWIMLIHPFRFKSRSCQKQTDETNK